MSRSLRVLFAVQGEGRGHMTQALAVRDMLARHGHTVVGALVGRSEGRRPPAFFTEGLGAPVHLIDSPNFAYHPGTRAISLGRTGLHALRRSWIYRDHLRHIGQQLTAKRPDIVVNFYEGMMGLFAGTAKPEVPVVCVGHQYMFGHPDYQLAPGQWAARAATWGYTALTAAGAARKLALSFYEADDLPKRGVRVTPPILRDNLFRLVPSDDGFLLAYLLHRHLADGLVRWHARRPEVPVRVFWDGEPWAPHPNLAFHPLDGERFLQMMARARGVVCTAGFESVSEAMWLGKPVFMLPTPGHLEQRTNALDAQRTGAGILGARLDPGSGPGQALDDFLAYLPTHRAPTERFRAWVDRAEAIVLEGIEAAAQRPALVSVPASLAREAA